MVTATGARAAATSAAQPRRGLGQRLGDGHRQLVVAQPPERLSDEREVQLVGPRLAPGPEVAEVAADLARTTVEMDGQRA